MWRVFEDSPNAPYSGFERILHWSIVIIALVVGFQNHGILGVIIGAVLGYIAALLVIGRCRGVAYKQNMTRHWQAGRIPDDVYHEAMANGPPQRQSSL